MKTEFLSMRSFVAALVVALSTPAAHGAPAQPEAVDQAPDPDSPEFVDYVMRRFDDLYRGERSHSLLEMRVKTEHWKRAMAMEGWSLGTEYSLIRILAPKKERGTATLKAKEDLFTYLNKTGRTIKITGGMMGGSWMGSHFTNDDLVRESRFSEDYDIKKTATKVVDGNPVYTFTAIPKPNAAVVWGKVEIVVRHDLLPMGQAFFDEDGRKVKELEFSDFREMAGRMLPSRMIMHPLDKPGEYTEIIYKTIEFGVDLDKTFFTLQRLKSM